MINQKENVGKNENIQYCGIKNYVCDLRHVKVVRG